MDSNRLYDAFHCLLEVMLIFRRMALRSIVLKDLDRQQTDGFKELAEEVIGQSLSKRKKNVRTARHKTTQRNMQCTFLANFFYIHVLLCSSSWCYLLDISYEMVRRRLHENRHDLDRRDYSGSSRTMPSLELLYDMS